MMANEDTELAHLFLVLKGNKEKREDWISIAKRCERLIKTSKTKKEAAEKAGISYQLLRSIVSLLKLPDEVQMLIKEKKILFDAAQRLNTIKNPQKQKEVAKVIAGLPSHDQREIIQYAKKFPKAGLADYKKRVMTPRKVEKLHVAIIPFNEHTHQILKNESKKRRISLEKFLSDIIQQWIKEKKK